MNLSVIVAAYNASHTLERCLDSIVSQGMDRMEILVVDDGSSDSTGEIADGYAERYESVAVIHQKNGGLSAARNAGMAVARGEYVTFVDSDDYLLPRIYPRLIALAEEHPDADIIEYSIRQDGFRKERWDAAFKDAFYSNTLDYWLGARGFSHCYACNKLFRRPGVQFPVGRHFEDVFFMGLMFQKNPRILTSSVVGYVYTDSPDSISTTVSRKNLCDLCEAHSFVAKVLNIDFADSANACYYLDVLNHQLSARLLAGRPIDLPHCRVPLEKAGGSGMKLKAFVQNWFGIQTLAALMWICYTLTFKKIRTIK